MISTVGPHPPAVYWRRRAIVGGVILAVGVTFTTCAVNSGADESPATKSTAVHRPSPTTAEPEARGGVITPPSAWIPVVEPSALPSVTPTPSAPIPTVVPSQIPTFAPPTAFPPTGAPRALPATLGPAPGARSVPKRAVTPVCGKEDISVDASLPAGSWPAGAPHQFTMVVHNQANNPCTVDAGPSRHEFRIERDHRVIWSSTHCDPPQGTGMVTMSADEKRGYTLVWSGTTSQPGCAGQRTKLDKGTYGLIVRLGTETSDRREFTLT